MAADRYGWVSFLSRLEDETAPVESLTFRFERRGLLYQALTCGWTAVLLPGDCGPTPVLSVEPGKLTDGGNRIRSQRSSARATVYS